ncbi:acyl-CoA dehydrogenase family protein [Okibacterium endophyticum]
MTAPSPTVTTAAAPAALEPHEAIASAQRLRPTLIEEAPATEERRFHSEGLHLAFVENGYYNLMRPKRYGGYEFSAADFMRVMREIARGDMATAWCLALASGHNLQVGSWFGESVQNEVFRPDSHFAAPFTSAPSGTLERVEGGFIHSGLHAYASGVPYSTHFMAAARHTDTSGPPSTFLVPRSAITIVDDWGRTLGLKGSGSHSVRIENVFIPSEYVLEGNVIPQMQVVLDGAPGVTLHGNPMYYGRMMGFFGLELSNAMVGAVRGALDEYEALMPAKRISIPPFNVRSEDPSYLRWFGETEVQLLAAEAILDRAADMIESHCERAVREGPQAYELKDDFLIHVLAREGLVVAWNALLKIVGTAGSSAAVNGSRLERIYRDASMAWGHFNTISGNWSAEGYARGVFGTQD